MKRFIVFCLVMLMSVFFGCDSSAKHIIASDIIYQDSFELPFKAKKAYAGGDRTSFATDKNLQDIKECADNSDFKNCLVKTTIYGEQFLLIEKLTADKKTHYYMVANVAEDFYEMIAPATDFNDSVNNVLMPLHFFELALPKAGESYKMEFDKMYKVKATINDFKEFYEKIDIFDISLTDSSLNINVVNIDSIYGNHSKKSFRVEFTLAGSDTFATYSFI